METGIDQSALRAYISADIDGNFIELHRNMCWGEWMLIQYFLDPKNFP